MVKIVEMIERTVPLPSPGANAYIDFADMTASVVAVVTDVVQDGRPVVGYGFTSNGRYAAGGILRDRIFPRLHRADPAELLDGDGANLDPARVWDVMMRNEKPGGHGERSVAVGAVDMAVWDVVAKIAGVPLYRLLADRYRDGQVDDRVFVYAAGGYYQPDKDVARLQDEVRRYLDLGYTVVKIKIGGGPLDEDLRRVEAVLALVGSGDRLAVDANGGFDRERALEYADALAPYGLGWYEEPGDPLDFDLHAAVAAAYDAPIATGENLFSTADVRNLVRHGGLRPDRDILQFDCALSYGLVEYLRTLDMLAAHGWSPRACIPHGGHQLSLNIAAGLGLGGNESYPEAFAPFGGFADEHAVEDGSVGLPDVPGIGFEAKSALYRLLRRITGAETGP